MISRASQGAAILAVEVTRQGHTTKVTERESLEREIMRCLSKRFSLTYNNPSMNNMFTSRVGYLAEKPGATQILEGNIPDDLGLDAEAKEFLSLLAISQIRTGLSSKVQTKDFINYWGKAQEKTASSFSGLHFGHYISIIDHQNLSGLYADFLDLVLATGTVLQRWAKGLSVMLEKVKGNINVDKLRAILLMEADYNFVSKLLLGVRLMQTIEDRKGFPEELGGSRKNHEAVDIALNR